MGNFFGSIYCWFENFFGLELAEYLWGQASPYQSTNMFIGIGLSMLGITLAIVLIYYYAIDHPKLGKWWGWTIFLIINSIFNFIVGWQWVLDDQYKGLMVTTNPATKTETPLLITESNILCFGVSNMLLSILVFILFSLILKWGSRNCPHVPF